MTYRKLQTLLATTALCGVGAFTGTAAIAADQTAAASSGLEEIIVTAQRRTENLQVVPLSVMAVSGETLEQRGSISLEQLDKLVPGVIVQRVGLFPGAASLSVRGVGYSGIESYTDPEVAVYINGIYQARNGAALVSALDVSSIEVLRGPQGTLYGRNAFAGAISVKTNKPEMTGFSGTASANYGNMGEIDGTLVANMPIIDDKVAARLAFKSHNMDGLYKNNGIVFTGTTPTIDPTLLGKRIGAEHDVTIRPSLRLTPNEDWDINLIGEYYRDRSQSNPQMHIIQPGSALAALGLPGINPFGDASLGIKGDGSDPYTAGLSTGDKPNNVDMRTLTGDIAYKTSIGTFKLLMNYQATKSQIWSDSDGENTNIFNSGRWENYHAFSGEVQYLSSFSDVLDVTAGVFFLHDHYQTTQLTFSFPATLPFPATEDITNTAINPSYINNSGKRSTYAPYIQAEYHITDQLSAVLGGRYSWEKKYDQRGENTSLNASGIPRTTDFSTHLYSTVPGVVFGPISATWDNFAPRAGLNYKVTPDVLLFGFWQRAYKSGGFNANSADGFGFATPYGVERVDNYEGGVKSEWYDHRLRTNLNVYYSKYHGLQRSLVTPSTTAASGVTTVTTNAANLRSYGAELEVAAKPVDQLTLFSNVAWNHAAYTSYCAPLAGVQTTTTPAAGHAACGTITTVSAGRFLVPADYSNLRPVRAPHWDISFGATKDVTVGNGGTLSFTANANYRSSQYVQLLNVPYSYAPGMITVDGTIRWQPESSRYGVTLWGRNLTNNIQIMNYLPITSFADAAPTPPRTYGITLNVNF